MMGLWDEAPPPDEDNPFVPGQCVEEASLEVAWKLRPYQDAAIDGVLKAWEDEQSTLLVLPTGTGKTTVFSEIIRRRLPSRSLVLAHRAELIQQAAKRLESAGVATSIEMAELTAPVSEWFKTPVVVSTVQTQCAGGNGNGRMTRFLPEDFGLVIVDEAHHGTAASYRRVLDYYKQNPNLKILGVTASPDRTDESALGQVFDSVAYDYEILDAIKDGWLVPIEQQMVMVDGLDYSHIRTTAGDLNGADLAAVMENERTVQEIAAATIGIIGDRRTLVFTASVKQAEVLADIFNRYRPGMADWVCGATPKPQRHQILQRFKSGQTQVCTNCNVLSEGFDEAGIQVIVQARPTKSRCLYAQQAGRGLRPSTGIVDGFETAEERRQVIAQSSKPSALIIDFVGNAGRHKLMTAADILGGKLDDEVIALATERARSAGRPTRTDEEIAAAIAELEERKRTEAARKARLVARAQYRTAWIDPFSTLDIAPERARGWDEGKQLSEKQAAMLRKQGIDPDKMPYGQARAFINEMFRRWNLNLCTVKQAALLKRHGYETKDLPMAEASRLIDALAHNNWRRPA